MDSLIPVLADGVKEVGEPVVEGPAPGEVPEGLDELLPLLDIDSEMGRGDLGRPLREKPELADGDGGILGDIALRLDSGRQ
jgi:hypothetical protein